jgi:hypothetical protein
VANIELAIVPGGQLDAATCHRCPGGAKIYPPEALAAHLERHDVAESVPCKKCGRPFRHVMNETMKRAVIKTCGYCRRKGKGHGGAVGERPKGIRRHEEKAESILRRRRND